MEAVDGGLVGPGTGDVAPELFIMTVGWRDVELFVGIGVAVEVLI